jgi:hypothetical protein
MRQYLVGLAAAVAVSVTAVPAMAGCGGCAPVYSYSNCNPCGGASWGGSWGYATLPAPVQYYSVQPQYYYVNQGPTYTGPAMYAPAASYQQRAVAGWSGYSRGYYGYNGGPYANPSHHYYHGMPAVSTPTVYSYRRAYRPSVRYGASHRYGYSQRYVAPRAYRSYRQNYAPRYYAPRYQAPHTRNTPMRYRTAPFRPQHSAYAPRYAQPRYSVAPQQYRYAPQRPLRRYN